jgi:hypothetical protein
MERDKNWKKWGRENKVGNRGLSELVLGQNGEGSKMEEKKVTIKNLKIQKNKIK